jgi:fumarate hydratase, class I
MNKILVKYRCFFIDMYKRALSFLVENTSTILPFDIQEALITAKNEETRDTMGALSMNVILENIFLAKEKKVPICQDTGFPTFFVVLPKNISRDAFVKNLHAAICSATKKGILRPNAVDSITGKNSLCNIGEDFPKIFWEQTETDVIEVSLLLKGGGSENVSDQLSLPTQTEFGYAKRDGDGVKKAVLQIVKNAKGKGCPPGILGIHIGSDRANGYAQAKKNLLIPLFETNENPILAKLEAEIISETNALGIGAIGLGGKTTLLGVKISASHRIPASFFVSVSYGCWALRRGNICIRSSTGEILEHSFPPKTVFPLEKTAFGSVKKLSFPAKKSDIEQLENGDIVLVSGKIFTGRDRVHEYALSHSLPKDLSGSALYHCGPIALKQKSNWKIISAGPTTSIRQEEYEADFIEKTGIRAIIGKGGMGEKTSVALKKNGAVYLHAIGGVAAFYAKAVRRVYGVDFLEEFGMPEAMWELEVKDFLCMVTMNGKDNPIP